MYKYGSQRNNFARFLFFFCLLTIDGQLAIPSIVNTTRTKMLQKALRHTANEDEKSTGKHDVI